MGRVWLSRATARIFLYVYGDRFSTFKAVSGIWQHGRLMCHRGADEEVSKLNHVNKKTSGA